MNHHGHISCSLILISLFFAATTAVADTDFDLSGIEVPNGYESYREANLYVRFGDGLSLLRESIPNHEFGDSFLDDWFFDGVVAFMDVSSPTLPDGINTAFEAHQSLVCDLKARWGDHSFSVYDQETGVGRFVNYAGAFVSLSWRMVGDTLVVVESQDLVEVLVIESSDPPDVSDSAALWQYYRKAANADDVDRMLIGLGVGQQ